MNSKLNQLSRWAAVPWWLIRLRLTIAPSLVVGAALKVSGSVLAAGLTLAFLSDVFDGIIARRVGASTPELRLADSKADVLFYLCVLGAAWIYRPEPLVAVRWPFAALVVLQLGSWIIDRVKFHRATALHSYTAKAWGITLFAAAVALFCSSRPLVYNDQRGGLAGMSCKQKTEALVGGRGVFTGPMLTKRAIIITNVLGIQNHHLCLLFPSNRAMSISENES